MVEVGRRAVLDRPRRRVPLVATHHESAARLAPEVDEPVGIAHRWQVDASALHGLRQQVLMRERHHRDLDAGQASDLVRVHASGVHDDVGRDRAVVFGHDPADASAVDVDPDHPRVRADLGPAPARALRQRERQVARIEMPVRGDERRALNAGRIEEGEPLEGLLRGDHLERQAEGVRPALLPAELLHPLVGRRQSERADLVPAGVDARLGRQAPVELGAVHHHPRERDARAQLPHEPRRVERRARRQLAAVEQQHVLPAELGQVVGDARAGDAAADDDRAEALRHLDGLRYGRAQPPAEPVVGRGRQASREVPVRVVHVVEVERRDRLLHDAPHRLAEVRHDAHQL